MYHNKFSSKGTKVTQPCPLWLSKQVTSLLYKWRKDHGHSDSPVWALESEKVKEKANTPEKFVVPHKYAENVKSTREVY